jgi:head-tail adaptor
MIDNITLIEEAQRTLRVKIATLCGLNVDNVKINVIIEEQPVKGDLHAEIEANFQDWEYTDDQREKVTKNGNIEIRFKTDDNAGT